MIDDDVFDYIFSLDVCFYTLLLHCLSLFLHISTMKQENVISVISTFSSSLYV